MDSIKILVVDPHQLSREGLKHLLDSETHDVIGVARSVDDAADQIAKGLAPDLVICGLEEAASGDQSAMVDQIRASFPNLKLVILANSVSSSLLLQAINAGVNAYLRSEEHTSELQSLRH